MALPKSINLTWKQKISALSSFREKKLYYLEFIVNDQVLVLNITVGDPMSVKVVHSINDLSEYITSLSFCETLILRLFDALK